MADFFKRIDGVFYGRKSYELTLSVEASDDEVVFPVLPKIPLMF